MSTNAFDALTREAAAGVSRRGSLLTLGSAALAASAASPDVGVAKKKGQNCKKKEKQRCTNDAAACVAEAPAACQGNADCIAEAISCCDTCSANEFLTCLIAATAPTAAKLK
jgi:hypothetical protein